MLRAAAEHWRARRRRELALFRVCKLLVALCSLLSALRQPPHNAPIEVCESDRGSLSVSGSGQRTAEQPDSPVLSSLRLAPVKTDDSSSSVRQRSSCDTDDDCSLNGRCVGNAGQRTCACTPPWGGVTCGALRFRPAVCVGITAAVSTQRGEGAC